jgi:hypothetical protein
MPARYWMRRSLGTLASVPAIARWIQQAVAGCLDDAAAVLVQNRIDQLLAMGLLAAYGSGLVGLHVPRIADHVDRQDGGESAFHAADGQRLLSG